MADLAEQVLSSWVPPPELEEVTTDAVALVTVHLGFMRPDGVSDLAATLARLPEPRQPWSRVARAMFVDAVPPDGRRDAVLALTDDPDPRTAAMAWQWAAILAENEGAIEEAAEYLERALAMVGPDTTAWEIASLNTQAATQALNTDDHRRAERHARIAIPLLERLHADEDAASDAREPGPVRRTPAVGWTRRSGSSTRSGTCRPADLTADLLISQVRAEILLRRGDAEGGLQALDGCLETSLAWGFLDVSFDGLEPWTLIPLATDLAAHARFAETPARIARGAELAAETRELLGRLGTMPDSAVDYPVTGMAAPRSRQWLLRREADRDPEPAVRLLALAAAVRLQPVVPGDGLGTAGDHGRRRSSRPAGRRPRGVRRPPGPGAAR